MLNLSFSRYDALVLTAGMAAGTILLHFIYQADQLVHPAQRQLGVVDNVPYALLLGVVFGLAASGPVVLLAQRARGRTTRLLFGEWLWLTPLLLYSVVFVGSFVVTDASDAFHLLWFGCWLVVQSIASGVAIIVQFQRHLTWTERLGSASCLLAGVAILTNLIVYPPDL